VFPLWAESTKKLINEFTGLGYKTIVICVSEKFLDKSFAGRIIDQDFIKDLPPNVDPCGENGEFHTFVFDGPLFKRKVDFKIGETVYRKYEPAKDEKGPFASGFWFTDLIPTR
jgi:diphthamide synthase (EF-2-diphthine--ammonia ligase)